MYTSSSTIRAYHTITQSHKHHLHKPIIILHSHNHSLHHNVSHTYLVCSFDVCTVLEQHLHNTNMAAPRRYVQGSETTLHHHHVLGGRRLVCGRRVREEERVKQGSIACCVCVLCICVIWCVWRVGVYVHIHTLPENYVHANYKNNKIQSQTIHNYSSIWQFMYTSISTTQAYYKITQSSSAQTNHHPPQPQPLPTSQCLSHVHWLQLRCLHCAWAATPQHKPDPPETTRTRQWNHSASSPCVRR